MVRSVSRTEQTDIYGVIWNILEFLLIALFTFAGRLLVWAVRFPLFSVPVAFIATAIDLGEHIFAAEIAIAWVAILVLWACLFRRSWNRFVTEPIRWRWYRWSRYRSRWTKICALHGLTAQVDDEVLVPRLLKVLIGTSADALEVQLLNGQNLDDWHKQSRRTRPRVQGPDSTRHAVTSRRDRRRGLPRGPARQANSAAASSTEPGPASG